MSNALTSNSGDAYAQAALADILAHPNQQYTLSPNVYQQIATANGGIVPGNSVLSNDPIYEQSFSCKWFGANCVDDSKYVTADCPSYLKFFNLCKASGNFNQAASDSATASAQQNDNSGCAVCDKVSAWFSGKIPTIVSIGVGFVLLYGAFLIWKK